MNRIRGFLASVATIGCVLYGADPARAGDVTYPQLNTATTVQDTDLIATWRASGPLTKTQASVLAAYIESKLNPVYAQTANNLADLANEATARTNLGLGSAATQNVGTSGNTVCLMNANCTWSGTETFNAAVTFQSGETVNGSATFNGTTAFNSAATFTLSGAGSASSVTIAAPSGGWRPLYFQTGSTQAGLRWAFQVDNSTESGSNTGANLRIDRFTDAGADIGVELVINRATGAFSINSGTGGVSNTISAAGTLEAYLVNATAVGSITTNGTSTSYNTTSDYRLKENVKLMQDGLSDVMALRPVTFDFRADPEKRRVHGFLAHEVQAVLPEAVTGRKDATDAATGKPVYQELDYSKLVPVLVEAVQEQQREIDRLKGEIKRRRRHTSNRS